MLDLEAIRAREKAANEYADVCVGLDAEDWIVDGYGPKRLKKDFSELIAEVERLSGGIESVRELLDKCHFISQPLLVSELLLRVVNGTFNKSPDK